MNFLKNIQEQPEHVRKIILWTVVIILGALFLFVWIQSIEIRVQEVKQEDETFKEFKPPDFNESLKNIPAIEMPELLDLSEEELNQLLEEELIEENEQPE